MSISLNELSNTVSSMGVEIWQESWYPNEQSAHNYYEIKRTDYDICIGFASQYNIDANRVGQSAPIISYKHSPFNTEPDIAFRDASFEGFWLSMIDGCKIEPARTDAIMSIELLFIKFNGLLKL